MLLVSIVFWRSRSYAEIHGAIKIEVVPINTEAQRLEWGTAVSWGPSASILRFEYAPFSNNANVHLARLIELLRKWRDPMLYLAVLTLDFTGILKNGMLGLDGKLWHRHSAWQNAALGLLAHGSPDKLMTKPRELHTGLLHEKKPASKGTNDDGSWVQRSNRI